MKVLLNYGWHSGLPHPHQPLFLLLPQDQPRYQLLLLLLLLLFSVSLAGGPLVVAGGLLVSAVTRLPCEDQNNRTATILESRYSTLDLDNAGNGKKPHFEAHGQHTTVMTRVDLLWENGDLHRHTFLIHQISCDQFADHFSYGSNST